MLSYEERTHVCGQQKEEQISTRIWSVSVSILRRTWDTLTLGIYEHIHMWPTTILLKRSNPINRTPSSNTHQPGIEYSKRLALQKQTHTNTHTLLHPFLIPSPIVHRTSRYFRLNFDFPLHRFGRINRASGVVFVPSHKKICHGKTQPQIRASANQPTNDIHLH